MKSHQIKSMELYHILHPSYSEAKRTPKNQISIVLGCHPPFDDRAHNHCLIFDICAKGLQPPILPEMPDDYVQMMQRCWDVDPSKRPTSKELRIFAYNKEKEIHENESLTNKSLKHNSLIKRLFKSSKIKKPEID